ncbi:MAG: hypothetical protein OWQ57_04380 [Sulfobacillus sp.]|nr:hypothetical protein [Sulfobacillus sp.]
MDHVDLWLPANLVAAFRAHCAQVGVPFEEAMRLLMQHELQDAESSITPSPTTASVPTPDRRDRYRRFWNALLHHLRRNRVPLPQNWFSFPLGRAGFTVDIAITGLLRHPNPEPIRQ